MNHNTEVWLHLWPWGPWSNTCMDMPMVFKGTIWFPKEPFGFITMMGMSVRFDVFLGRVYTLSSCLFHMDYLPLSKALSFILWMSLHSWIPPVGHTQVCFLYQRTEPDLKLSLLLVIYVTLGELPYLLESQFFHLFHGEYMPMFLLFLPWQGSSENQMRWFSCEKSWKTRSG